MVQYHHVLRSLMRSDIDIESGWRAAAETVAEFLWLFWLRNARIWEGKACTNSIFGCELEMINDEGVPLISLDTLNLQPTD